jgi:hypothetical protein
MKTACPYASPLPLRRRRTGPTRTLRWIGPECNSARPPAAIAFYLRGLCSSICRLCRFAVYAVVELSPEVKMALDRRRFLTVCGSVGFASTLLPGVLYTLTAQAKDKWPQARQ